jgi:putative NADH-flavin reductase
MRVAVIGASGRTGRATVKHALAAGMDVVSVVRNPSSAPEETTVARADARDREALAAGIKGADAVVSCLGHTADDHDPAVLRDGAAALVDAMTSVGVSRLVAVSAAGAFVAGDDPLSRFIAKPILARVLRANNEDTRAMEAVIRASDTSWTLLRPSRLIAGDGRAGYRSRLDVSVWWHYSTTFDTVGRAAVDGIGKPGWAGHAVFITE